MTNQKTGDEGGAGSIVPIRQAREGLDIYWTNQKIGEGGIYPGPISRPGREGYILDQ